MALVAEQAAFLVDACNLIEFATLQGFTVTGGELFRTVEQQQIYVASGRSTTLNSYHLKRLAIDLNFFKDGVLIQDKETLQPVGDFWEGLNPVNKWGGNWNTFKDLLHFERRS